MARPFTPTALAAYAWVAQAVLLLSLLVAASAKPFPGCRGGDLAKCPGSSDCEVAFFEQKIDHFNWAPPFYGLPSTYQQRYFLNKKWWKPGGPIFFYFGNEDNVELYVNHTGLMWEHAEEFQAMLVFAEHRYYGQSKPFNAFTPGCMSWLTTEQALADFAYLLDHLQGQYATAGGPRLPVIGFGGSYGGMMAAWFRMKYAEWVDGVIAASAPILSFIGLSEPYNPNAFATATTFDTTTAGGASDRCKNNLKAAWPKIISAGTTDEGRALLERSFRSCSMVRPKTVAWDDPLTIVDWAAGPWATLAMGNFPYPSNYLTSGGPNLPAWPVRVACSHLDADFADDGALFEALREAAATLYNASGKFSCFKIIEDPPEGRTTMKTHFRTQARRSLGLPPPRASPQECTGKWGYHWCTEIVQPFTTGTPSDIYHCPDGQDCAAWDFEGAAAQCEAEFGVRPRPEWARVALASDHLHAASNIVFSNGLQDPWHAGGVLKNISETVHAVLIPNGAHHVDLMFSDPADADYPDILHARNFEMCQIRRWVAQARATQAPQQLEVEAKPSLRASKGSYV